MIITRKEIIMVEEEHSDTSGQQATEAVIDRAQHREVMERLMDLYAELFCHDGYGEIRIEMRILRRGQKEVILHCGKQYRYVLDCPQALKNESAIKHLLKRDLLA